MVECEWRGLNCYQFLTVAFHCEKFYGENSEIVKRL